MIDPPYVDPQRRFQPKRWAYRCAVLVAVLLTFAAVAWAAALPPWQGAAPSAAAEIAGQQASPSCLPLIT